VAGQDLQVPMVKVAAEGTNVECTGAAGAAPFS
jgi:hypothetical protein